MVSFDPTMVTLAIMKNLVIIDLNFDIKATNKPSFFKTKLTKNRNIT